MIQFTNTHDFLPFLHTWENVWKLLKAKIQELTSIQNKFEPFINGIDIKFDQPVPMAFNSLYCETSPNSCGSSGLFG